MFYTILKSQLTIYLQSTAGKWVNIGAKSNVESLGMGIGLIIIIV